MTHCLPASHSPAHVHHVARTAGSTRVATHSHAHASKSGCPEVLSLSELSAGLQALTLAPSDAPPVILSAAGPSGVYPQAPLQTKVDMPNLIAAVSKQVFATPGGLGGKGSSLEPPVIVPPHYPTGADCNTPKGFGTPACTTPTGPTKPVPPPVTAVPEPGTWCLMLVGFGLVGLARRRAAA